MLSTGSYMTVVNLFAALLVDAGAPAHEIDRHRRIPFLMATCHGHRQIA